MRKKITNSSKFLWGQRLISTNYQELTLSEFDQYDDHGHTALTFAILDSTQEIVTKLIDAGVDVCRPNKCGFSPIFGMLYNQRWDLLNKVIDNIANINILDPFGNSILMVVIRDHNNYDLINTLISNGIDLQIKNRDGETALDLASEAWDLKIITDLINTGKCVLENFVEYVVLNNKLDEFISYVNKCVTIDQNIFIPLIQMLEDRNNFSVEDSDNEDFGLSAEDEMVAPLTPIAEQNAYEVSQEFMDELSAFGVEYLLWNDNNHQNPFPVENHQNPVFEIPVLLEGIANGESLLQEEANFQEFEMH